MKLFQQSGYPTSKGKETLKPLQQELMRLFVSDDIKNLSETQKRILGSWIAKMAGDMVAESLQK